MESRKVDDVIKKKPRVLFNGGWKIGSDDITQEKYEECRMAAENLNGRNQVEERKAGMRMEKERGKGWMGSAELDDNYLVYCDICCRYATIFCYVLMENHESWNNMCCPADLDEWEPRENKGKKTPKESVKRKLVMPESTPLPAKYGKTISKKEIAEGGRAVKVFSKAKWENEGKTFNYMTTLSKGEIMFCEEVQWCEDLGRSGSYVAVGTDKWQKECAWTVNMTMSNQIKGVLAEREEIQAKITYKGKVHSEKFNFPVHEIDVETSL